ncbi:hypothetical protein PLESTF_000789500 [Pleodorina starrii]|nr:hypothetical protein PLESTF_000789500 [Pleodorina starrii]
MHRPLRTKPAMHRPLRNPVCPAEPTLPSISPLVEFSRLEPPPPGPDASLRVTRGLPISRAPPARPFPRFAACLRPPPSSSSASFSSSSSPSPSSSSALSLSSPFLLP